eukprot:CAMPEP_0198212564 /NCGR_PEP_ID=MMETSP1445-20131203/26609_1 /TAXON_ID=36898 /ORGANISM="Pyramimonas sp., Strain CCMP2087" /LENGTH=382 /DNA_ID=CAMNT_0043887039 /DNA_START=91 /DNA_END=1239 /DNA_ORIENTATION=-
MATAISCPWALFSPLQCHTTKGSRIGSPLGPVSKKPYRTPDRMMGARCASRSEQDSGTSSDNSSYTRRPRPLLGMALAAATLFAAPTFDLLHPSAALAFGKTTPKVDVLELQDRIDRLEAILEKLDIDVVKAQKGETKAYTPGMYNAPGRIDRSRLYAELGIAVVCVFGLTFVLEKSSLFPTIVRANKQGAASLQRLEEEEALEVEAKEGGSDDDDIWNDNKKLPVEQKEDKVQSAIKGARGGLDMVQVQLMRDKQEKFLAEAARKEEEDWADEEGDTYLSTEQINKMSKEARAQADVKGETEPATELAGADKPTAVAEEMTVVAEEAPTNGHYPAELAAADDVTTVAEEASANDYSTTGVAATATNYEASTGVRWWTGVKP